MEKVLLGTIDDENPLALLRANPLVWTKVFGEVERLYSSHILNTKAYHIMSPYHFRFSKSVFPESTGININMMPIVWRHIPDFLRGYEFLIRKCMQMAIPNWDKVMYLTIQESLVEPGQTQRRSGLHIERPGSISRGGHLITESDEKYNDLRRGLCWGLGYWRDEIPVDGIFMMSNVDDSCQIWPNQIKDPHEISDAHAGIECLRKQLGEPRKLKANELVWFTDTTPHEALPSTAKEPVMRQFFRLVVGDISVCYSKHNTPNPLGVQPNAPISDEDKFVPVKKNCDN